ncbi:MAG TPA: prepilin-type N-terminal cleavage/methylation domain-containing protein [Polyangia bacterium]|nr:prepilin-type N-terminal cleavage/methylation domain-containing protein [Polyangia bacterium]
MISPRRQSLTRPALRRAEGFTLIEVVIVLLVVALVSTLGVRGVRSLARSNLREGASHMSGAIRFLFDRASVTGKYHRLVIDISDGKYWAEVSDDKFYAPNQAESELDRKKREDKEAAQDEEARKKKEKNDMLYGGGSSSSGLFSTYNSATSSFDMSKLDVGEFRPKRPRFAAFKETALKPVKLGKVRIKSFYTPRMTDPVTAGRVYLYFYPLGQTEPAVITLTDESGQNVYSLVVHPITGRVRIYSQEVQPNLGVRYDDEGNQVVQ